MFVADTITIWVEALQKVFDQTHPVAEMRNIPVVTDYPASELEYPGIWVNFSVQGDVTNVGIGHVEWTLDEDADDTAYKEVLRWRFAGLVEITLGAMSNLERARLIDELTKTIAIARVDKNQEGALREHIERNDLIGMNVVWESFSLTGFAEANGTPWGTDDVIYEASVMLTVSGEVVLDPRTESLVPLSAVLTEVVLEGDPDMPQPGVDGWH